MYYRLKNVVLCFSINELILVFGYFPVCGPMPSAHLWNGLMVNVILSSHLFLYDSASGNPSIVYTCLYIFVHVLYSCGFQFWLLKNLTRKCNCIGPLVLFFEEDALVNDGIF